MEAALSEGVLLVKEGVAVAKRVSSSQSASSSDLRQQTRERVEQFRRLASRYFAWRQVAELSLFKHRPNATPTAPPPPPTPQPRLSEKERLLLSHIAEFIPEKGAAVYALDKVFRRLKGIDDVAIPVAKVRSLSLAAPSADYDEKMRDFYDIVRHILVVLIEVGEVVRLAVCNYWRTAVFAVAVADAVAAPNDIAQSQIFSPSARRSLLEEAVQMTTYHSEALTRLRIMDHIQGEGEAKPPQSSYISIEELLRTAAAVRAYVFCTMSSSSGGSGLFKMTAQHPVSVEGVAVSEEVMRVEGGFAAGLATMFASCLHIIPAVSAESDCLAGFENVLNSVAKRADASEKSIASALGCSISTAFHIETFYPSCFSTFATNGKLAYMYLDKPPGGSTSMFSRSVSSFSKTFTFETTPVEAAILAELGALRPTPTSSWTKGLWESSQTQQLANVIDQLYAETFTPPFHVYSPLDTYEELEAVTEDESSAQVCTSHWSSCCHAFLKEMREDCAAALQRKPSTFYESTEKETRSAVHVGDVVGQWRAGREVIKAAGLLLSTLLVQTVNVFDARIGRFGFAESNMIPFVQALSDLYTMLALHFNCGVVNLLLASFARRATTGSSICKSGAPEPPKLHIDQLLAIASTPSGPHVPYTLKSSLTKLSVLLGIGIDKVRENSRKLISRIFLHYTTSAANNRTYFFNTMNKLKKFVNDGIENAQNRNVLDSDDESETAAGKHDSAEDNDERWDAPYSPYVSLAISSLLFPLASIGKHIAQEVVYSILNYVVLTIVETMVAKVVKKTLGAAVAPISIEVSAADPAKWPPAGPKGEALADYAPKHPCLATLHTDLDHLRAYLVSHVPELNLHTAPCWALPSHLIAKLAE